MIKSLQGVAFKFIKYNKFNVISSIISITVSIGLIISMFMFTANSERSIKDEFKNLYGYMDISVGVNSIYDNKLDKTVVNNISSLDGIEEISPILIDETNVGVLNQFNVYTVGVDNSNLSKSRYKYEKNIGENDVIINSDLSEKLDVAIGDTLMINNNRFNIIDIFNNELQGGNVPDTIFININKMKDIIKDNGQASYLLIKLSNNTNVYNLVDEIKNMDSSLRIDVAQKDEEAIKSVETLRNFMTTLAFLVITICSLFILSNFKSFLYSYKKQFSLIRAIGGSSRQGFKIVFIQCTFINTIGVVLGVIVSYLGNRYFISILTKAMSIDTIKVEYFTYMALLIGLICFIIMEVFMLIPAIKSSKILPLMVMMENEILEDKGEYKKILGIIGVIVSIAFFIVEMINIRLGNQGIFWGIASSIVLIISIYIIFPYYIKVILNKMLPLFKLLGGNGAVVAVKNISPQVKKNSVIILALSTMIIISIFGETFLNSILKNEEKYLRKEVVLDILVTDRQELNSKLGVNIKDDLERLNGVENVAILSKHSSFYYSMNNEVKMADYQLVNIQPLVKEGLIPSIKGSIRESIVVSNKFADANKINIGDKLRMKIERDNESGVVGEESSTEFDEFTVAAVVSDESSFLYGDIALDWINTKYINEFTTFDRAVISSRNLNHTINALENYQKQYPQIKYTTFNEQFEHSRKVMFQRWVVFIVVIITVLFSIVLGIINMLINNILGKRKEYAILRTLKLTKFGLIKIILTQAIIYILLGVLLGSILGVLVSNIIRDTSSLIYVSYKLMLIMTFILLITCLGVFIPFAISISNKKIAKEIQIDER